MSWKGTLLDFSLDDEARVIKYAMAWDAFTSDGGTFQEIMRRRREFVERRDRDRKTTSKEGPVLRLCTAGKVRDVTTPITNGNKTPDP